MKLARVIMMSAMVTLAALATVAYTSCKDACKDVTCANGGTCKDGTCVCRTGFSGANCEIDACWFMDCAPGNVCKNGICVPQ